MSSFLYILGKIIGIAMGIGFVVLYFMAVSAILGLAFPKLRKKKDDDSD